MKKVAICCGHGQYSWIFMNIHEHPWIFMNIQKNYIHIHSTHTTCMYTCYMCPWDVWYYKNHKINTYLLTYLLTLYTNVPCRSIFPVSLYTCIVTGLIKLTGLLAWMFTAIYKISSVESSAEMKSIFHLAWLNTSNCDCNGYKSLSFACTICVLCIPMAHVENGWHQIWTGAERVSGLDKYKWL